jgi:hypothetical protein
MQYIGRLMRDVDASNRSARRWPWCAAIERLRSELLG